MSGSKEAMEYIWQRIPKQKDGNTIKYNKADLDYLYLHGFVDTRRFPIETWKKAFRKFAQEDGSFILNKDQFMALRLFRYQGQSDEVFDPFRIQEGPWPDNSLQKLYDKSIAKASELSEEAYWAFMNTLKERGHVNDDGHLMMSRTVQIGLKHLIDRYPSPRRRLELEVDRLKKEREGKIADNQKNRDSSGFAVGQSEKENKVKDYKNFLSTKSPHAQEKPVVDESAETIDLKSLKKPKGNFRG